MTSLSNAHGTLCWKNDISTVRSLPSISWLALEKYATHTKWAQTNCALACQLSAEYSIGGRHIVRRLDFEDGTSWVARLQLCDTGSNGIARLQQEIHTIQVIRERSTLPVPQIHAYEANYENTVGAPFMIMEYIAADTAMDSFGGRTVHNGQIPSHLKKTYYTAMAEIQVQIASIRFPQIGTIVKLSDGTYSVGPIPKIGGPFDSAAEFFKAWAGQAKFPYNEATIRERTPSHYTDAILKSIKDFPLQLQRFAKHYQFQEGPFPLFHTDLYKSNILVDSRCRIKSVIDWEDAIVAPWEMVEFIKDLSFIPPIMDGPFYREDASDSERLTERKRYIEIAEKVEKARQLDNKFSITLGDERAQNLAHATWLYLDGRIGYYSSIFTLFG